ncbi:MAG: HAD-IA family hydrolase, partial [Anaerolineales bacterium]|nr:HAD-IA family hydrolase [Anaerolineales bacterium]
PQVGIYHLALERLGAPPEATLFVDDFIENVEAARALGMHAVHFRDTPQALADINRLLVAAGNRAG